MQQASAALLDSVFEKASKYDFPCPHCGSENPMVAYTPDYTGYHGSCANCHQEITSPAGSTRYVAKGEKPFHGTIRKDITRRVASMLRVVRSSKGKQVLI